MSKSSGEVNSEHRTKAPRFQELSFKNWKKFFIAFLMRHDRAHLAITEKDPETLITPEEEEELSGRPNKNEKGITTMEESQ
jgi:hypothetical protein